MSILRILNYPDPRLKNVAKPVVDCKEKRFQTMVDDMLETLINTPHCGGLAATQLDIKDPYRVFVFYDDQRSKGHELVVVNPEIIATEGEQFVSEGCMSVYPDHVHAPVKRPGSSTMTFYDRHGKEQQLKRDGYIATLFQHEIDHLDGKVYLDRLGSLKRKMVDKKVQKVRRAIDRQ